MHKPGAVRETQGGRQVAANVITALPLQLLQLAKEWLVALAAASLAGRIKIGVGLVFRQRLINHWHAVLRAVAEVVSEFPGRRKGEVARNRRYIGPVSYVLWRESVYCYGRLPMK